MKDSTSINPNQEPGILTRKRAWWMLAVLSFVSLIDWADRALISIVAESIKLEFEFSDTQLGLLMGFAFTIGNVVIGIGVGRIADKWNRRNIVASALGIWSLMTLTFGFAKNFGQMFIVRIGIGVGTSGCTGPSMSMLGDVFFTGRRGIAMALFNIGGTVGFSIGLAIGGLIAERYGWRQAMIYFGVFGLLIAAFVATVIREPERRSDSGELLVNAVALPIRKVLQFMVRQRSLVHFVAAASLMLGVEYMVNNWTISFFVRSHGLSISEAGSSVAMIWLVSGVSGGLVGGLVMDRLTRIDARWQSWMCVGISMLTILIALPLYLTKSLTIAMIALFFYTFVFSMSYAPGFAVPLSLLSNRMRAMGIAIIYVFKYGAAAVGPIYVGSISEALRPVFGANSLKIAMLSGCVFLAWASVHFYLSAKTLRSDYGRV